MRIAIVDDISEERTLLRNRLESQFSRRNVHVDIFEYENGETFLTAAKECPFTVVFLDIYMNGSNGIDTAKELRRSDTDCLLIFTTTSTDHALEGFQVRALHYLVKPYSENDISALTDEILSRIPDSGKYYPFFQTEALYLLISNLIMEIYPQSDCPMGHFRKFAFFLHFCYTFFKKERLFLWRLILYRN